MHGRQSPLDFLAQASLVAENERDSRWMTTPTVSDGREKITVVPGPSGQSIRLHRGNGRLPPIDLSKPFAKKCRNRECNNLGGQPGKPRSIYCSKRCQSREQNLRQGRIKNVRSPTTVAQQPIHNSRSDRETQRTSRSRSVSPLSSPEERSSSPELDDKSPSISPIPFGFSPVPFNTLSTPSPVPLPFSNNTPLLSATNILAPSPLNVRLGMTPSPISMSPSLSMMGTSSGFSPVQMSATTPIYLPKPSAVKEFSTPIKQERPTKRQRGNEDSSNNLTLAPILT
eukprot:TRINITY_DN79_c0_g1_i1.p1 TRINITY_DN79_c0_g1~~TRINITY_DN79_c0_g1_i1.p1  ORF type:complete len:329 (+),score=56.48 TRINITY_DN79_c0_g1_i1:137-988(+)